MIASLANARVAAGLVALTMFAACAAAPVDLSRSVAPRVEPMRLAAAEPAVIPEPQREPAAAPVPTTPATAAPTVNVQEIAPVNPPVNEEEQQVIALLVDLQRYATATAEELRRELAAAIQAVNRTRTEANRIRLAVLLTLPAAGATDDARALALLDSVAGKSPINTPTRQLAVVLYAQINERLRDVGEEKKKTAQAQEKLDQLRAVERSLLLERNRNSGGAGGGGGGGGTGR
jgi:hypothetical protein